MLNFELVNPTKIFFGKGQIAMLSKQIQVSSKILLLYGGGSIKKNGIYEQVHAALKNHTVIEFGGIEANPEYETLLKGLHIIKSENITFLLAVGGGSVIDGTKFLSSATLFKGDEPWDILSKPIRTEVGMPFATVLTMPATGSEMNSGAVITRASIQSKLGMGGPGLFPQFSILDPEVVQSIPLRQLQNGVLDAFTHVLEQYITYPVNAYLQDRFAESILKTLTEVGPKIIQNPGNYELAANYMWCCTMALNGLIQKGVPTDWATHAIGHELTALFGIDHARTLAIIAPSLYTHELENKKEKLAQYAERVWGAKAATVEESAKLGISKTVEFIHALGVATHLSEHTKDFEGSAEIIAERLKKRGWIALGERKNITPDAVKEIVRNSY